MLDRLIFLTVYNQRSLSFLTHVCHAGEQRNKSYFDHFLFQFFDADQISPLCLVSMKYESDCSSCQVFIQGCFRSCFALVAHPCSHTDAHL